MSNYNPPPLFDIDWSIVAHALRDSLNARILTPDGGYPTRIFQNRLRERRILLEAFYCALGTTLLVIRGTNRLTEQHTSWLGQLENTREYTIPELTTILHQMLATDRISREQWFSHKE